MKRFVIGTLFLLCACSPSDGDGGDGPRDAFAPTDGFRAVDAFTPPVDASRDTGLRPEGRYATIWDDLGGGDGRLGYPLAERIPDTVCAWQPFTGGTMLWLEQRSFAESCVEFCDRPRIFSIDGFDGVATAGDPYYRHPDDWSEAIDPFACEEANRTEAPVLGGTKPLGPVRGFGKVWCENDVVRTAMGAATEPELGGPGFERCSSQLFQGGLVVHNPNESSYWVLFEDGDWQRVPE